MDFTLSLAHFCELHGPTSVLCTQVLPSPCTLCRPISTSTRSSSAATSPERPRTTTTSYFPPLSKSWRAAALKQGTAGFAAKDIDRCASCRMTIPDKTFYDPTSEVDKNRPPIRTKESVHVCAGDMDDEYSSSDDEVNPFPSPSPEFFPSSSQATSCPLTSSTRQSHSSCHSHNLDYVTSPSPASTIQYAALRTAVIRALSGEVLPRGQMSGPLWFGSTDTGYVIAYQFEVKDIRARGRRRQYALLALAGHEITRALAAATLLWACFEQIANNIVSSAQAASRARRRANNSDESALANFHGGPFVDDDDDDDSDRDREREEGLQEMMRRPGVSSFLTGRGALGRMPGAGAVLGDRRGGAANAADIKATSIADLLSNDRFYCELHMVFVKILQQLGKEFGGLQVRSLEAGEFLEGVETSDIKDNSGHIRQTKPAAPGSGSQGTWTKETEAYPPTPQSIDTPLLTPSGIMPTGQRQVAV